jgi:hypothetical protein
MGCLNGEVIVIINVALIHVVDVRASMGYNLALFHVRTDIRQKQRGIKIVYGNTWLIGPGTLCRIIRTYLILSEMASGSLSMNSTLLAHLVVRVVRWSAYIMDLMENRSHPA